MKPIRKIRKTQTTSLAEDELDVLAKQPVIAGIIGSILIICMSIIIHPDILDIWVGGTVICGLIGCLIYIIHN